MSKNEQEKRETLADIVAEIRAYGAQPPPRLMWLEIADRIEAAWKRERDELIYAYDPTKAGNGRLPDGSAYALEAMREPVTACHAVGNAAAMREALIEIDRVVWDKNRHTKEETEAHRLATEALTVPARNCDRLSAEQCKKIFKMEMGIYLPQEATDRDRSIALCTAYGVIDALFAPSTERKGEGDGR